MMFNLRKAVRTAQSAFPVVKGVKEFLHYRGRRLFRIPHERDFEVIRLLSKYENSFVDVGANQGQSIESILIFRPDAQIVSFEANPRLAEKLRKRYAARPSIRIYPTGLGDRPGEFTLYIPSYNGYVYDGLASFDREASEGMAFECDLWLQEVETNRPRAAMQVRDARLLSPRTGFLED